MSDLWSFLKLPLSLPISPVWDFLICLVLERLAYKVAFSYAGEYGSTSGERGALHWLIRIVIYLLIWSLVCFIILAVKYIIVNWVWVLIISGVLAVTGLIFLIIRRKRVKR